MQTMTRKLGAVTLAVILLLGSGTQWVALACQYCGTTSEYSMTCTSVTFSPGNPPIITEICDGTKQEWDAPACLDTYDSLSCTWPKDSTVTVTVTTYTSPGCGPPNWQIDPNAPPTKDVPQCATGCGC